MKYLGMETVRQERIYCVSKSGRYGLSGLNGLDEKI